MTVSNFHMESKGAANLFNGATINEPHEFTYVVADESQSNFHAFFDEHETWITHRDDGHSLNVDADIVQKLMGRA
ncbi:hypothetical protein [Aridibaculum aurantiacum]|uniref:hypothetical protein n=1 Tax=Aridibaculum aurantiacum TaxID=2810307 RepID=UPI001A97A8F0|nr:hypothetical protein [Aridibaculum aurantiacum]